jgi:peroxin-2
MQENQNGRPVSSWNSADDVRETFEYDRFRRSNPGIQSQNAVSKAGQLEASALDAELSEVLQDQLNRVLSFFRPSLMADLQPELEAFFRSLIFYFSVWTNNPTPGNMFQNLRYVDDRPTKIDPYDLYGRPPSFRQRCLHAVLHVVLPWIWTRTNRHISQQEWGAHPLQDWRRKAWVLLNRLETLQKFASLLHFAIFLVDGRYRGIRDRLLRMRLLHMDPMRSRSLSFEYMNQLLVWHTFLHFLGFLKPLVSSSAVRDCLTAAWRRLAGARATPTAMVLAAGACSMCGTEPAESPHANDCGHRFCYYCLRSAVATPPASRPACGRCSAPLRACVRVGPEGDPAGAG